MKGVSLSCCSPLLALPYYHLHFPMARGSLFSLLGLLLAVRAAAQTLSDCHTHSDVEYCVGPDGQDVAVATHAPSPAQPTNAPATTTASGEIAEVTGCHGHGADMYVMVLRRSMLCALLTVADSALPLMVVRSRSRRQRPCLLLRLSTLDAMATSQRRTALIQRAMKSSW